MGTDGMPTERTPRHVDIRRGDQCVLRCVCVCESLSATMRLRVYISVNCILFSNAVCVCLHYSVESISTAYSLEDASPRMRSVFALSVGTPKCTHTHTHRTLCRAFFIRSERVRAHCLLAWNATIAQRSDLHCRIADAYVRE